MDEKTPCALYVRVSTKEQTVENQEIALREYCERNGYEIYEVYKEEGVSGAKVSRPELDRMLQDMRAKKFNVIIVWKLDRLGRSVQHLLQILQELQNKNTRLIITDMNMDTGTPQGKFFFTIIAGVAELERELIRERILAGLKRSKSKGQKLGRPHGSKDKKDRRKSGYHIRWAKERQKKDKREKGSSYAVEHYLDNK